MEDEIIELQKEIGSFLYYGRVAGYTMFCALNSLATAQSKGNHKTIKVMMHFLNYCASHPDVTIRFTARNMIVKIHSNAFHLAELQVRNRVGGYFFFGNKEDIILNNGAIQFIAKIIKNAGFSTTEAGITRVFVNTKETLPIRLVFEEM